MLTKVKTEKQILSNIHHPFIIGLHGAFQTPEKLILVMVIAAGGSMAGALYREKRSVKKEQGFIWQRSYLL